MPRKRPLVGNIGRVVIETGGCTISRSDLNGRAFFAGTIAGLDFFSRTETETLRPHPIDRKLACGVINLPLKTGIIRVTGRVIRAGISHRAGIAEPLKHSTRGVDQSLLFLQRDQQNFRVHSA